MRSRDRMALGLVMGTSLEGRFEVTSIPRWMTSGQSWQPVIRHDSCEGRGTVRSPYARGTAVSRGAPVRTRQQGHPIGRSTAGCSLFEMLMVVVLLGILSAIVFPRVSRFTIRAKVRETASVVAGDLEHAVSLAAR